jgi:outer membrane protein assembly factor BamA
MDLSALTAQKKTTLSLLISLFASHSVMGEQPARMQNEHYPPIEEIIIKPEPIFDESNPRENNAIFRLVNRFHVDTKEHVIRDDLTFTENDQANPLLLEESARRLRSRRYVGDAKIRVLDERAPNGGAKVEVSVRDVWTLTPKVNYSRSGGNTRYSYGIQDSNFLGLGKTLRVEHTSDEMRDGNEIVYRDPNFGNQHNLILGYADNSDGRSHHFTYVKPFNSIRTTKSAGITYEDFERHNMLYDAGNEVAYFGQENEFASAFYGMRLDRSSDNSLHRVLVGYDNSSDRFYDLPTEESPYLLQLPYDRKYQSLWVEYQYEDMSYIEALNISQINRTEDINLGAQWRVQIGYVDSDTLELEGTAHVELGYAQALQFSSNQMLFGSITSSGFYDSSDSIHSITEAEVRYHWNNFHNGQFFISAKEVYGRHLFRDMPLELGGDNGLRGYDANFQAGDRLRLLNVEQRIFGRREWFSLFYLGAAVFYDEGRAWGESAIPQTHQKTLRNVGLGLRISGTRTGGKDNSAYNVTHIDYAYPLNDGIGIEEHQFSIQIKSRF